MSLSPLRRIVLVLTVVSTVLCVAPQSAMAGGNSRRDTTKPRVTIAAPTAGSTLSGAVTIMGTASDNISVAKVEVSVDGGAWRLASGTTSWSSPVDTTTLSDATHTITSRATDTKGNAASTSVSVIADNTPAVSPPASDTTAPSIVASSPGAGATVAGTITVTGTASDNVGLAQVKVAVDSGAFQAASGAANWTFSLDTAAFGDGSHTITARATDTSGLTSSASVGVTFANASSTHMVTPEGVTIDVAPDVVGGWTAQQIYDLLKPNAYQLDLIGPSLTIKVQTQYSSGTATSASSVGGVYTSVRATIYLKATSGQVFTARPDYVMAHEYGHVWTRYHFYLDHQGDWTPWLVERGLLGDPRLETSYNWAKAEMIADDYRMLFGTSTAIAQTGYINPDIADPRTVPGLRDWFISTWA